MIEEKRLTSKQLLEIRKRLDDESRAIQSGLGMAACNAATVTLDQSSVGRLSRMDAMQQQAMAASQRERLLFRQRRVEAALQRLEEGEFGHCCQCEEPLHGDRLAADPAAPFCADCQEEIDERRRTA